MSSPFDDRFLIEESRLRCCTRKTSICERDLRFRFRSGIDWSPVVAIRVTDRFAESPASVTESRHPNC
jgi:hypothetical protein